MIPFLRIIVIIILISGILIRITIKDSFYWSSILYYALPSPILVSLSLWLCYSFRKQKLSYLFLAIALSVVLLWINGSYISNSTSKAKASASIIYWNTGYNHSYKTLLNNYINPPDVMVILEQVNNAPKPKDYHYKIIHESIGIYSKTPIQSLNVKYHHECKIVCFDTKINNIIYHLYLIDAPASIKHNRKPILKSIYNTITHKSNTIIIGDFNTPYESIHFNSYKETLTNAFSKYGNGFRETWCYNIPILSLDHIWTTHDVNIKSLEKRSTWKSDHSILKLNLL